MRSSMYISPGQRTALEREIRVAIGLQLRAVYETTLVASTEPVPRELADLVARLVVLQARDRCAVEPMTGPVLL
jgi:hypothetical protein